ncbi:lipopolysaccharide biosynthesis protein [Fulvimarina sp. MAC3]|uniref:lipopolysaccharide biosynthesis protein n=1 Tax=Fulvimarina sp. MAC3 TaxID=3148887 RepID=UPI0031FC587D
MTANFEEPFDSGSTITPAKKPAAPQKKPASAIGWAAVGFWSGQLISLGTFLVLVTILAPIDIGHFALALIVQMFIGAFVDKAMGEVVIQRSDPSEEMLSTAFFMDVGLAIILVASAFVLAQPIASLLGSQDLVPVLRVLVFATLLGTLGNIPLAILEKRLDFQRSIKIAVAAQIIAGASAIALALLGWGIWALVANQIVVTFLKSGLAWIGAGWRPRLIFRFSIARTLFAFWANTIAFRLTYFARYNTDRLIIGMVLGPTILGFYAIAHRVVETVNDTFCEGVAKSILAVLSPLQKDRDQVADVLLIYARNTAILAFPIFVGLALIGPDLIILMFGERWSEAAFILPYLSVAGLAFLMVYLFGISFRAIGCAHVNFWMFATAVIFDAIILVTLLPIGLYVCLMALVVRAWLYLPVAAVVFSRLFGRPIGEIALTLSAGAIGGAALALVLLLLSSMPTIDDLERPMHFAFLFAISGVLYLAFIALFARSFIIQAIEFTQQSVGIPPSWRKRNA